MSVESSEDRSLEADFQSLTGVAPRSGVTGARLTTFSVGGPIRRFVEIEGEEQAVSVIAALKKLGQKFRIIGAGSNLVLPDEGLDDWVLRLGPGMRFVEHVGVGSFRVGGAMSLMALSRQLSEEGFSGLEFAGGIPAAIGGAVAMNAGAHGGEIADVLVSVLAVMPNGETVQITAAELKFSYRKSSLPSGAVVLSAIFKLCASSREAAAKKRAECLAQRKARQPLTMPSAGSVFKNPSAEVSAGFLLEKTGLKGRAVGGAEVSGLHANWIVNPARRASANDIKRLVKICQDEVLAKESVSLTPELIFW